jgi:hypothetical protein
LFSAPLFCVGLFILKRTTFELRRALFASLSSDLFD